MNEILEDLDGVTQEPLEEAKIRKFIGVKQVTAFPLTLLSAAKMLGRELAGLKEGVDDAYGWLVTYQDGYRSWSPDDVFTAAYRETGGLTFGLAVEALKLGKKVARAGWNGKGMWLALSGGYPAVKAENFWNEHNAQFAHDNGGCAEVLPTITMKTADDKILMGWLASQTDVLAEDWQILD